MAKQTITSKEFTEGAFKEINLQAFQNSDYLLKGLNRDITNIKNTTSSNSIVCQEGRLLQIQSILDEFQKELDKAKQLFSQVV